jgi:hypothetical protein
MYECKYLTRCSCHTTYTLSNQRELKWDRLFQDARIPSIT